MRTTAGAQKTEIKAYFCVAKTVAVDDSFRITFNAFTRLQVGFIRAEWNFQRFKMFAKTPLAFFYRYLLSVHNLPMCKNSLVTGISNPGHMTYGL